MLDNLFPSYDDLLQQDQDVKVTPVRQGDLKSKVDIGIGICGGMSVAHVTETLSTRDLKARNPFKHDNQIQTSANLSKNCEYFLSCFDGLLHSVNFLKTKNMKPIEQAELQDELKKEVQKTVNDGKGRGAMISGECTRSPFDGGPIKGNHSIAFTSKKHEDDLVCTALDSNMFFAKGKGLLGCNKVAEKIADTAKAYDQFNITVVEARTRMPCTKK